MDILQLIELHADDSGTERVQLLDAEICVGVIAVTVDVVRPVSRARLVPFSAGRAAGKRVSAKDPVSDDSRNQQAEDRLAERSHAPISAVVPINMRGGPVQ